MSIWSIAGSVATVLGVLAAIFWQLRRGRLWVRDNLVTLIERSKTHEDRLDALEARDD